MKGLLYYQHFTDSHHHPKFLLLRARYGFEGEGRFWVLNNIIAGADNCEYNIGLEYNLFGLMTALGFPNTADLKEFIQYLVEDCKLVVNADGMLTTGIVTENLAKFDAIRQQRKIAGIASASKRWGHEPAKIAVPKQPKPEKIKKEPETLAEIIGKPKGKISSELKEAKDKKKLSELSINTTVYNEIKAYFADFYKTKFSEAYYFTAKDGVALKQLIYKIRHSLKDAKRNDDDESMKTAFYTFITNINDEWILKHFSIPMINSKYNEILSTFRKANVKKVEITGTNYETI